MNGKERIVSALNLEPVDRTPVWFMRQAGRHLPEYRNLASQHSFWERCMNLDLCTTITMQPIHRYKSIDGSSSVTFWRLLLGYEVEYESELILFHSKMSMIGPVFCRAHAMTQMDYAHGEDNSFWLGLSVVHGLSMYLIRRNRWQRIPFSGQSTQIKKMLCESCSVWQMLSVICWLTKWITVVQMQYRCSIHGQDFSKRLSKIR